MTDEPTPLKTLDKRSLRESRFTPADQVRNTWSVVPEEGTPMEALMEPAYWVHVARKLRPGDIIEVRAEDGAWFARLYVQATQRLSAKVALLDKHVFEDVAAEDAGGDFEVMWKGPHHRHSVIRKSDRKTLQHGFESREAAFLWLANNMKALAA